MAQAVKNPPFKCRRPGFDPWGGKIPWRRGCLPTLVFLPGEFHGQRSLAGCSLWGCKEADTTEWLTLHTSEVFSLWLHKARGGRERAWAAGISSYKDQSILKEISPEYSLEGLSWSWSSNTLATWCEELIQWKRPWCWERLKTGGEGDNRGWDSWNASLTQWAWVWVSSRSWWRTGKPGMLQSMGLQRVRCKWLNWTESYWSGPHPSDVIEH